MFSDVEHNTYTIGVGKLTVAGLYVQTQIIAYIKSFQVCVNRGIHYIQAPEKNKEQNRVINILPNLVSKSFNSVRLIFY